MTDRPDLLDAARRVSAAAKDVYQRNDVSLPLTKLTSAVVALDHAIADAEQRGDGGGWRPISEARPPRDGTPVQFWPSLRTAWWDWGDEEWAWGAVPLNADRTVRDGWPEDGEPRCPWLNLYLREPQTHWRPCDPPQEQEQEGRGDG